MGLINTLVLRIFLSEI